MIEWNHMEIALFAVIIILLAVIAWRLFAAAETESRMTNH